MYGTETGIAEKLMHQLGLATRPSLEHVWADWTGCLPSDPQSPPGRTNYLYQAPFLAPPLFTGSRFRLYAFFKPGAMPVGPVRITAVTGGLELGFHFLIAVLDVPVTRLASSGQTLHRLGARAMIRDLEEGSSHLHWQRAVALSSGFAQWASRQDQGSSWSLQIADPDPQQVRAELLEISLRYGLVSSVASFVATEEAEYVVEPSDDKMSLTSARIRSLGLPPCSGDPTMGMLKQDRDLANREARLNELFAKLDKLEQLNELFDKIEKLEHVVHKNMPLGEYAQPADLRSGPELKREIGELSAIIMNPNTPERDSEAANINAEKAMNAYEKTPEYAAEVAQQREEWLRKNEPLNKAAFGRMTKVYNLTTLKSDMSVLERVKLFPVLRLLMMSPDTILKKRESDFRTFILSGLSEDELRAVCSVLPNFRNDQQAQKHFAAKLIEKIEEVANAVARPAPPRHKKFVPRMRNDNHLDLFVELFAKMNVPVSSPHRPLARVLPVIDSTPPVNPALPLPDAGTVRLELTEALDALLSSAAAGNEKDMAAKTRQAIASLKKLATAGKRINAHESGKLEQMATSIVEAVKVLVREKQGTLKNQLAQILDNVKTQANKISCDGLAN